MTGTIMIKVTEKEIQEAAAAVQPYRAMITATPELLSLLYDIDLLPEQIKLCVNANRMIAVCELFKRIPKTNPIYQPEQNNANAK